ncbi:unnamed protein product [Discosporangium mesarthrocarpum]
MTKKIKVIFYDMEGGLERTFDYSAGGGEPSSSASPPCCQEFTCASFNPTGDSVALGSFDGFRVFSHGHGGGGGGNSGGGGGAWEESCLRKVESLYTVTALDWRADGSRLALGSLCGACDVYDTCVRRVRYKGRFELTYVSMSQVIVRRLATGARIVLRSGFGCEITAVNIYRDWFSGIFVPG